MHRLPLSSPDVTSALLWALSAAVPSVVPAAARAAVRTILLAACWVAALACHAPARAGLGPENLFLVVNASSPDSVAVANAFATIRDVPPINVLMLPWQGGTESMSIAAFRSDLLLPVLRAIDARRLGPQIDCIVYSSDFPWRIDFAAEMPPALAAQEQFKHPSGSLTGMTMLYQAVQAGMGPVWLDQRSNRYWRPLDAAGIPISTDGFRSWYGWGVAGDLLETGGQRYVLSVMLGVTAGRGNTVPEIVRTLSSSADADGTRPAGTIYFVTNEDVRTTTRSPAFQPIVDELNRTGVKAEIIKGTLPVDRRDVAGLMTGRADFDWPGSRSTIVPGAICENLTSFGAIFTPSASQTPLSAFIRAGAAGSSGTVTEPYAIQAKFPHPSIQLHYARGATLAEAFYQSLQSPYQLLVVGDPLCRPWAAIPQVDVALLDGGVPLEAGEPLSGLLELAPSGTVTRPSGAADAAPVVDRFSLFVDGVRLAQCGVGERLPLDTTKLADGHHELSVAGCESSSLESLGRWKKPVRVSNHGRSLSLRVEPAQARQAGTVRIAVKGDGIDAAAVFAMGRVLGRTSGPEATIEVPAALLGRGRVEIHATGRAGEGAANAVNAAPVTIEVVD
jgi:hypothetical protein